MAVLYTKYCNSASGPARVFLHSRERGTCIPARGIASFFLHSRLFLLLAELYTKYYNSASGPALFFYIAASGHATIYVRCRLFDD